MARPANTYDALSWELSPKVERVEKFGFGDFSQEEELCDYIDAHPRLFSLDILEEEYQSHEREWDLNQYRRFGPRCTRVDFMFSTDVSECVLVECKNPVNIYSEIRNAIAQLMAYRVVTMENDITPDRCLLVTSKYHPVVGKMIDSYELPIEVFVLGKDRILKLKGLTN